MPLTWGVVFVVAGASIALVVKIRNQQSEISNISPSPSSPTIILSIIYYLVSTTLLGMLLRHGTSASIRSPWEVIPWFWIAGYFIACIVLIFILKKPLLPRAYYLLPLILFFILSFSVALSTYRVGYGYDQFIHQATERAIWDGGEILPKPPYYLGQYALMVILSKLTFIPVELLDRFFLPLFAGVFLPHIMLWSLKKSSYKSRRYGRDPDTKSSGLPPLLFLALPFSSFIVTTPQGLANFFFLATIFSALPIISKEHKKLGDFLLPLVFSLATLSIHPLAGIPALLFTLSTFGISKGYIKTVGLAALGAPVALPATLLLSGFATFKIPTTITGLPSFSWQPHFHALLDISYTYTNNIGFFMVLISIAAGVYLWRTAPTRHWLIYPVSAAILFINAFLIKNFLIFPAVIGYEQGIFAARVYELARFALVPLLLLASPALIARILQHPQRVVKLSWGLMLGITITASMYASYPHVDAYEWSKGYSVSSADQHAVQAIHADAHSSAYVVLSNQSVSAAAVQAYGFPTNYAIPTSGRLYQLYSDMVYIKPAAQTMLEAMDEAKVDIAYFVINQYWTNADKIIEAAKREAKSWWEVDQKITVFKYQKSVNGLTR